MPPKMQPNNFAQNAAMAMFNVMADPMLDPSDAVMLGYPYMADQDCIAIANCGCGESVLRLALTLTTDPEKRRDNDFVTLQTTVVGGLDYAQLRRRLQRLSLEHFPVYSLDSTNGPHEYTLLHGKAREDKWAIVLVPANPPALMQAHWTFMTVAVTVPEPVYIPRPLDRPTIIFTRAPLCSSDPMLYWRCQPSASNMTAYVRMRQAGRACHCCMMLLCPHEVMFRLKWLMRLRPSRMVTLIRGAMMEDAARAEIVSSDGTPGWLVRRGPDRTTHITTDYGTVHVARESYDNSAVLRVQQSWLYGLPWYSHYFFRVGRSTFERLWPCHFIKFDIPIAVEEVDVPPLRLRLHYYTNREVWRSAAKRGIKALLGYAFLLAARKYPAIGSFVKANAADIALPVAYNLYTKIMPFGGKLVYALFQTWYTGCSAYKWWVYASDKFLISHSVVVDVPTAPVDSRLSRWYSRFYGEASNGSAQCLIDRGGSLTGKGPSWMKTARIVVRYNWYDMLSRAIPGLLFQIMATWLLNWLVDGFFDMLNLPLDIVCGAVSSHFLKSVVSEAPKKPFGHVEDLTLELPAYEQLMSRLATRDEVTREAAVDIVRRLCNEAKWKNRIDRNEFEVWLERVVTTKAFGVSIPANITGQCVSCLQKRKLHHLECRTCRHRRRAYAPEKTMIADQMVTYTGMRGIWSTSFTTPTVELKPEAYVQLNRKKLTKFSEIQSWTKTQAVDLSCRGRQCGPSFLGQMPICFPRGSATAVLGFCVRLGCTRDFESQEWVWKLALAWLRPYIKVLQPEPFALFISHFSGAKKQMMLDADREYREGWTPVTVNGATKMKGFTKAEKGYAAEYVMSYVLSEKETMKPRFICCPDPLTLRLMGPYTHAQTKWLAHAFPVDSPIFYAGCATPAQLNEWLNLTYHRFPGCYRWADDISRCDSNHSTHSHDMHDQVRALQFVAMPLLISGLFEAVRKGLITVGELKCYVEDVNFSGTSDTSYKNGLVCIVLRLLALLHMKFGLTAETTAEELREYWAQAQNHVMFSAAGDDGLTVLDDWFEPWRPDHQEKYRDFWTKAGFSVKLFVYPPTRWRMATYLAMRPVWAGDRYEWAPEPARRLRGLYWQIDNSMHPIAWARGVTSQVQGMSKHVPVLSHICDWYMNITKGPIAKVAYVNPCSPWNGYITGGKRNERATREFCVDYRVTCDDIDRFVNLLDSVRSPFVDFSVFVLDRIFQEES